MKVPAYKAQGESPEKRAGVLGWRTGDEHSGDEAAMGQQREKEGARIIESNATGGTIDTHTEVRDGV